MMLIDSKTAKAFLRISLYLVHVGYLFEITRGYYYPNPILLVLRRDCVFGTICKNLAIPEMVCFSFGQGSRTLFFERER